ncbi:MAG: hypothetical protein EXX96DRAFT_578939 [Benjaminiella poitrasii]|nr:MAG: hypothetical protein EXX96DRAFT_578939 [Benjaminiella poitrasii]
MIACERYQYSNQHLYFEDDDTNSSIASGSVISSRFSEVDAALNNLDDFMFEEPPSIRVEEIIQINQSDFPGVVKRIGLPARYQAVQETDDWNDDVQLPSNGISLAPTNLQRKEYDVQLSLLDDGIDDDDVGPSISQRASTISLSPNNKSPILPSLTAAFRYEPEEDEDDMAGLDFPDNMNLLSRKLEEKKNGVIPERSAKPSASIPSRIPISTKKLNILSKFQRENDDDDFFEGLQVKENAFIATSPVSSAGSYSSKQSVASQRHLLQQSRLALLNKGKPTGNLASRIARPSPINQTKSPFLGQDLRKNNQSQQQQQQLTAPRRNFQSSTQSSLHREADIASKRTANFSTKYQQQRSTVATKTPSQSVMKSTLSSRLHDCPPSVKKSASGHTLIARPKTKIATTYCSRLDNIDNLNDLRPTNRRPQVTFKDSPKHGNTSSPQRLWCKSMHTATKRQSALKLIKPNEQNLKKEYNDMRYDDITHSWKGNESSLAGFQEKPVQRYSRLMLMTNKQQKPSRYAAMMGNNMIFNAESQKWVSAYGADQECNELDEIEDLNEELHQQPKRSTSNSLHRTTNKLLEFKLSVEMKRQMMYEQEMHENWIKEWPLDSGEPEIVNEAGHHVGASKYFLFNCHF